MTAFGAHSEVGRLRKVMVHRPDLSLRRLTPSNHDDLLFDDVLWVERAQQEHDRFVSLMRERGVEVHLLSDLLAEALAASDEGRDRLIELVASEHTVGWSLVDDVRVLLSALKPDQLAALLIGGLTVAESRLDVAAVAGASLAGLIDAVNVKVSIGGYQSLGEGQATVHQCWSGDIVNAQYYLPEGTGPEVLGYWYPSNKTGVVGTDTIAIPR